MKSRLVVAWLLVWLAVIACGPKSSSSTTAAGPTPAPMLGPSGIHFATERVYMGDCAPAGSRGGCHSITFRPQGTYCNMLYDAAIDGTYKVAGQAGGMAVIMTASDPDMTQELALTEGGTKLGALVLKR